MTIAIIVSAAAAVEVPPGVPGVQAPPALPRLNPLAPAPHVPGQLVVRYADLSLPGEAASRTPTAELLQALLIDQSDGGAVTRRPLLPAIPEASSRTVEPDRSVEMRERRARFGLDRVDVFFLPPGADVPALCLELSRRADVDYAHPNYTYPFLFLPNDPFFSTTNSWGQGFDDLYGLKLLQCEQAWDLTRGDGITVAVVDSGIDYTHPDLAANVWINELEDANSNGTYEPWPSTEAREGVFGDHNAADDDGNGYVDDVIGYDFAGVDGSTPDSDPRDTFGHGTHVAGTIAAVGNNGIGVIGVAPEAKVMALKIGADNAGSVSLVAATEAVVYALENGARVANHSWGGFGSEDLNPTLAAAFQMAEDGDFVSVVAAGNSNADAALAVPAAFASTITVAAADHEDHKAGFSNFGLIVDVTAPGGGETGPENVEFPSNSILSLAGEDTLLGEFSPLQVGGGYLRLAGTSMASPHVAGVAALIRAQFPDETPAEVRARIKAGADAIEALNPEHAGLLGSGRVNALASLEAQPRPLLELVAAIPQGLVAPNREFHLVTTVRNTWRPAANVQLTLSSTNPLIDVFNANAVIGNVGVGEQFDNAASPFGVFIDRDVSFGERLFFELTIQHDDGSTSESFSIPIQLFQDVIFETGLPFAGLSAITIRLQDGNDNAFPDILTTVIFQAARYYRNRGDGTFVQRPLPADVGSTLGLAMADLDGDGLRDLLVPGNRSGTTNAAWAYRRIVNHQFDFAVPTGPIQNASHTLNLPFDYNRDGLVDLFTFGGFRVRLFRNDGGFAFSEVTEEALPALDFGGENFNDAVLADFDNDGLADVIATGGGERGLILLRNRGDGTFEDATPFADLPFVDAGDLAVGDFDGDNWVDIFAGDYRGNGPANFVLHNNGDTTFSDVTPDAGAVNELDPDNRPSAFRGSAAFDYDNDGAVDIFVQCGDNNTVPKARLYRNTGTGAFTDETALNLTVPSGVRFTSAFDDYDNDGDVDIYLSDSPFGNAGFFRNHATSVSDPNHWVRVRLRGTESDHDAFGARVTVRTGSVQQFRHVTSGDIAALPLHFGLGGAENIDEVIIRWPSGRIQRHPNQPVDTTLVFVEGEFRRGDGDGDGDLDLADFGQFAGCFGALDPVCLSRFDFNSDGKTNLVDFSTFAFAFSGSTSLLMDAGPNHTIYVDRTAQFFEPAVNGGLPPYSFQWDPPERLNVPNSPMPIADPLVDTTYTLTVTDALGHQIQDTLFVRVLPMAVVAGDDAAIFHGESFAIPPVEVLGGIPPYSYHWTPSVGLDQNDVPDPTAAPLFTTEFTVTVTDSDDPPKVANDTVRVLVDALYDLVDMNDGVRGLTILGTEHRSNFGAACANAGDLNGDEIDDIVIGANSADTGAEDAGGAYVIFGGAGSVAAGTIDIAGLDGTLGFEIPGLLEDDFLGVSVAGIGDVNGDNVADIAVGAPGVDSAASSAGAVYVVFGGIGIGAGGTLDVASLDGTNGFAINGIGASDFLGVSAAYAGDVNSDGMDDFVVGASGAKVGEDEVGAAYVIFGSLTIGTGGAFDLNSLNGTNGFAFFGAADGDGAGTDVAAAGDVNGDSVGDVIVGADSIDRTLPPANAGDPDVELFDVGGAYVIFGGATVGGSGAVNAADLNGGNGFLLLGDFDRSFTGFRAAGVDDFNDDGADDLLIGSPFNDTVDNIAGAAYVVYGGAGVGASGLIDLGALNAEQGFTMFGTGRGDAAGYEVARAGDVNGDNVADMVVSIPFEDTDNFNQGTGSAYVLFGGKGTGASGTAGFGELIGPTGFRARGVTLLDEAGLSVSAAGDFNNDGVGDVLIGADNAQRVFPERPGAAYVIFGKTLPVLGDDDPADADP